jgi:hypothetical protein
MKRQIKVKTVPILLSCLSISGLLFGVGLGISPSVRSAAKASAATPRVRAATPQILR